MKRTPKTKPRKKVLTGYRLYEYFKAHIAATSKSHQEYETRIYNLYRKLGI